jgi:hypothetical protein
MTKKGCSLFLGLSLLALNTPTFAQEVFGPEAGDWEVTLGGGGASDKNFDSGAFALNGSLGYYFTRPLELSVRQSIAFADAGDSQWNGSTRLALDYHFDLKRFRPYIGVNFGGIYGDTVDDSFIAGLGAGVKHYVLEKTFIFAGMEYNWLFKDTDRVDNNFDDGQFVYNLGIGFNF